MALMKPQRIQLLLSLLIACLLLAACDASGGASSAPTATIPAKWRGTNMGHGPQPTITPLYAAPRPLPAFSDPRVAYIGPDSLLHVVSLDGKADLAGTPIPLSGTATDGVWAAGTSPDETQLAYTENGRITLVAAASGARTPLTAPGIGDSALGWSLDQRYLTLQDGGAIECVSVASGDYFVTPGDPQANYSGSWVNGPDGWLDATHIAVMAVPDTSGQGTHALPPTPVPGSPETYATLESLNITTSQLRPIASVQIGDSVGSLSVVPGGQWTFLTNGQRQSDAYTPLAALINNATGAVTRLPHLSSLLAQSAFNAVLWRPHSTQAIVTLGFGSSYLLIDPLHDTATPIALPGLPEAWSPDGATLVVATSGAGISEESPGWNDVGVIGAGPFTLIAVRVGAYGGVLSRVTLTTHAMDVPVLGFVHTA